MSAPPAMPDFRRASSFQELVRLVEGLDLGSLLDQPVSAFLDALPAGAARRALEEMSRTGEIRTFNDALRNSHLRAEVRWRGGRPGETQLLRALQDWLGRAREAQPPPRSAEPAAEPSPPEVRASGLWLGMPVEELDRWAERHGLSPLLGLTDTTLGHVVEGRARYWLTAGATGRTLRELMAVTPPPALSKVRWARGPTPEVQEGLIELLERAAAEHAAGLAEEQAVGLHELGPPAEPGLGELWEVLRVERSRLREGAAPPPRARREGWTLVVSEDPPVATVQTAGFALCGRSPAPKVQIALQRAGQGPATACTCRQAEALCPLKVAALDLCLETVRDPATAVQARAMARARGRPAWDRLLARLDPILGEAELKDKAGNPLELGWRLRWRRQDAQLEPVGVRPRKTGRGLTLARLDLQQLRAQPALLALAADQRVATLLQPDAAARAGAIGDSARALRALAELVGHPRVFSGDEGPLPVRRGAVELRWDLLPDGAIQLGFGAGERRWSPGELLVQHREDGAGDLILLQEEGGLTLLDLPLGARQIARELADRGDTLPAEAADLLLRRLPSLARLLPNRLDPRLRGTAVEPDPRPVVFLELEPGGGLLVEVRLRPLPDGMAWPPGEGPDELYATRGERRVYVARDRHAEPARARAALAGIPLPPDVETGNFDWFLSRPDEALPVIEALQAASASLTVIWRGERRRKVVSKTALGQLGVSVGGKRDWLGLTGTLELDGASLPLDRLLAAIRAGSDFVEVDGETWVRLSEPFREALAPLAAAAQETRAGLELSSLHATLLESLEEAGALVEGASGWRELCQRVRAAEGLEPEPPASLQAELRDYQRQGFAWMARLATWSPGACLADDMGLGKTVQALAFLLTRASLGPALVVAPTSVCFNWAREAARFAPSLRVVALRGPNRQALLAELGPGDLGVASYDVVARDADALAKIRLATLILDEAQAIKNPYTRRAKAVFTLDAAFRLALTGTPVENRLAELWSLFRAITPGLLGTWDRFRDRFATPIERDEDRDRRKALARLIRPFLLRRLKRQVASELPPRTELRVDVSLSRDERVLYDQIRRQALQEIGQAAAAPEAQRRMRVLAALTKLRQAACHPRLVSPELALRSSKLEELREILLELKAEGHRVLVFSQFVRLLSLVREALEPEGLRFRWLDGATPERQRREEVDAFQRGEGDAFLISLKAGGTGLNLTAATYVIHLDPWWNPAAEDQATDRAHRIGQDQPVTVIRLVARGTLEESILALHADKRALAAELLEGSGESAALSAEELIALLGEGVEGVDPPDADEEPAREEAGADPTEPEAPPARPARAEPDPLEEASPPGPRPGLDERLIEFEAFLADEVTEQRLGRGLASQYLAALSELAHWLNDRRLAPTLLELDRHRPAFVRAVLARPLPRHRRAAEVIEPALQLLVDYGQAVGWDAE